MPKIVDHDQRRVELARAAVKVVDRLGIDGATLREIAREAGYSTGIIGHYFNSREDVLIAALGSVMDNATRRMAELSLIHRGLKATQEVSAELLPLDKRRTRENRVWLLYGAEAVNEKRLRRVYQQYDEQVRNMIRATLDQAIADQELSASIDPELEANRLLALSDGVSMQALFDRDYWTNERQLEAMDVHIHDLQRRGAEAPKS